MPLGHRGSGGSCSLLLAAAAAAAGAYTPTCAWRGRPELAPSSLRSSSFLRRTSAVFLIAPPPPPPPPLTAYEEYVKARSPALYEEYLASRTAPSDASLPVAFAASPPPAAAPTFPPALPPPLPPSDTDFDTYERVPWWRQQESFSEEQRKDRRTIFMHDDWVRHRSSSRVLRNMQTIGSSGINQALSKELQVVTYAAAFVVLFNMLFFRFTDLAGISHPGPLNLFDANIRALSLPPLPFTIMLPALSLLLVFRTNTAYFRWNEARTLWGGLINNCRNVVRQTNTFFPDDERHRSLKRRMAAETAAFAKALRNFLRGPSDDETLRAELQALVDAGALPAAQAEQTMAASNRPMYCLSALSASLRKADVDPIKAARIDETISTLVDLTGANERIFKSPIPLVYTRRARGHEWA